MGRQEGVPHRVALGRAGPQVAVEGSRDKGTLRKVGVAPGLDSLAKPGKGAAAGSVSHSFVLLLYIYLQQKYFENHIMINPFFSDTY
jgi:hypothetical protein